MKTLALIIAAACVGCNSINFSQTRPDGSVTSVRSTRLFWATETYTLTLGTNGAVLSATKSSADGAAIEAAAAGIVRGMKSAQ